MGCKRIDSGYLRGMLLIGARLGNLASEVEMEAATLWKIQRATKTVGYTETSKIREIYVIRVIRDSDDT